MAVSASSGVNKISRVHDVADERNDFFLKREMTFHVSERIQGKLQFMEKQGFGRAGKAVFDVLRSARGGSKLSDTDVIHLRWIIQWLKKELPRILTSEWGKPTVLLLADGAGESYCLGGRFNVATCGAMLFDGVQEVVLAVGMTINCEPVAEWKSENKELVLQSANCRPSLFVVSCGVIGFEEPNCFVP
jgi:hypothetical protein